ncbi:cyclin-B2-1 [Acrasis kona]|uniref:Cyclin-B2-1 n=1 Tax=Acrasis kona TaxID=1008807 RepID=A0AAW2Z266_9EUKA
MKRTYYDIEEESIDSLNSSMDCIVTQVSKRLRIDNDRSFTSDSTDSPNVTCYNESHSSKTCDCLMINFATGKPQESKPWLSQCCDPLYEYHVFLRNKEEQDYHRKMGSILPRLTNQYITRHRATCSEWLLQLAENMNACSGTVHMSCQLMDRFLSKCPQFPRLQYQLLAATCFWVSCKREESDHVSAQLNISNLITYCYDQFEKEHFIYMEELLLNTLEWKLSEVSPVQFLHLYSSSICEADRERVVACAQLMVDYQLQNMTALGDFLPSLIAASALHTALVCLGLPQLSEELFFNTTWYKLPQMAQCSRILYDYYHESTRDEGQH